MRITLLVEGKTEKVFLPVLRSFLRSRIEEMPRFDPWVYNGRIPTHDKLKRVVQRLLNGANASDYVIALTDVYTGSNPPDFSGAQDAKDKMHLWAGNDPRFRAHVALHDFEAWLLPYWPVIQRLARHNRKCPPGEPESVNHNHPPAHRIKEIFEVGGTASYVKPRDAGRILRDQDLIVAISQCPELKALVNTILTVCGKDIIE